VRWPGHPSLISGARMRMRKHGEDLADLCLLPLLLPPLLLLLQ
jgi:hypothetical protein